MAMLDLETNPEYELFKRFQAWTPVKYRSHSALPHWFQVPQSFPESHYRLKKGPHPHPAQLTWLQCAHSDLIHQVIFIQKLSHAGSGLQLLIG